MLEFLVPDWPAPANVGAFSTLRGGGVSGDPFASLNLGDHVGDDPSAVKENRRLVGANLPGEPLWLNQVHGVRVVNGGREWDSPPEADGVFSRRAGRVCVVMTADCLPVLLCDRTGTVVAAAHAGWRGLAAGILAQTVEAMGCPAEEILAWLGPAIGPTAFEVGGEVLDTFARAEPLAADHFQPTSEPGKWFADLPGLARQALARCGVRQVWGGECCTVSDSQRFFSHRRDRCSGRMGAFIWLENPSR